MTERIDVLKLRPGERYSDAMRHPAFRLGVLDAMNGEGFDYDTVPDRIEPGCRLSGRDPFWFEMADHRYEEGRRAVLTHGLRVDDWPRGTLPESVLLFVEAIECRNSLPIPRPVL